MSKLDLNCPKCNNPINFLDQIKDWLQMLEGPFPAEEGEEENIQPPTFCNLWCEHCEDMTTCFFWEENDESYEIEVPALRDHTGGIDNVVINFPSGHKFPPIAKPPES